MRIQRHGKQTTIWASNRDTYDWAHKPGASWPCSTISDHRLRIDLDNGDLVDLTIDGRYPPPDMDIEGYELTAFIDDALSGDIAE